MRSFSNSSFFFLRIYLLLFFFFFFFNDTATTEIYTLSLHDALPISEIKDLDTVSKFLARAGWKVTASELDRKSTRLNSSHGYISYAVFCLKKKKKKIRFSNTTTHYTMHHHDTRFSQSQRPLTLPPTV